MLAFATMEPLYAYALVPVVATSALLFFSTLAWVRTERGLLAYSGAIMLWSGSLLLAHLPSTSAFGLSLAASGAFVAAGYLHAAFDVSDTQRGRFLVWIAYVVAIIVTFMGAFAPGVLYDPVSLAAGPLFWPSMGLAFVAATVPMGILVASARANEDRRKDIRWLLLCGVTGYTGAWINALSLAHGSRFPAGMALVLVSLMFLAVLVRRRQDAATRRLLDRNLAYAGATALISAGFVLGVLSIVEAASSDVANLGVGAAFLVLAAAVAFEPIRVIVTQQLGRTLSPKSADLESVSRQLSETEQKVDQQQRLAELGTLASAVAHEIRNPLGVIAANLKLIRKIGADEDVLREIEGQLERSENFIADMLAYSRPRPIRVREVELKSAIELAISDALRATGSERSMVDIQGPELTLDGDPELLRQALVNIIENALLMGEPDNTIEIQTSAEDTAQILVRDHGPGIDELVMDTLFDAFVTTRKRDDRKRGTGLGLAITRSIIDRHGGTIEAANHQDGGAIFTITLPFSQPELALATGSES